ncbi:dTDP-glucose 4,6-dehydratase [Bacilliculturomica massiliensis]|uniref:dTDP-glucose 4,6-dehydratase n=1 Tax=Bacilliculturomica massiliensis TaxID=1917867 RepID=UPI0010319280|nr:dTDP-glucose 4,6-dehydratase [Bacilliculturomica massiliensis]
MDVFMVTGGAGFIGSNFIHYMLGRYPEAKIVCVDLLTYAGKLENLSDVYDNKNLFFEKADITDQTLVFKLFDTYQPDYVINFAAESHVDRSIINPDIFFKTNILGTQVLLDASMRYKVKRFHQVSTDEVYGDLPLERPDLKFTENSAIKPSSPYSASKASADLLVQSYIRTFNINATISRCSNNYGPYQYPEKLIPVVINKAIKKELVPVYGSGCNVRDWLHVNDHCSAIDSILHSNVSSVVYNIGGGNEKSNLDLVRLILRILGEKDEIIEFVPDRRGHDLRYSIDASKIQKELDWKPKICFDDGLEETVRWYVDRFKSGLVK